MALIFLDGMDKYGPANSNGTVVAALLTAGEWTSTGGTSTFAIVAPLSATGQALNIATPAGNITKTLPGNYPRLIGGMRFAGSLVGTTGIQFNDAGTNQAGITISTSGTFIVRNGSYVAGTVLGTSTATVSANTTHYLEWDITFANAGSYQLWLDGVSILSGSGDTTATANAYATQISLAVNTAGNLTVDDFYLFDTTGSTNNAVLLTSPRIETQFPTGDGAVQFAVGAAVVGNSVLRAASGNTANVIINDFRVKAVTPGVACTLQSISIIGGPTSHLGAMSLRPIVYADSGGSPGALLGSGSTATGPTASALGTLPLTTGVAFSANTQYWIGFMFSATNSGSIWASGSSVQDRVGTATFGSGAPGTAPSTSLVASAHMWGNVTVAAGAGNWWSVGQNPTQGSSASGFGDRSYVYESVVGEEDLYTYPALSAPPSAIYAVAVKASVSKSDAGAKTVSVRLKSGATDSAGTAGSLAPATSYGWLTSHFPFDPNGSVAWTLSALNAAQAGVKVES